MQTLNCCKAFKKNLLETISLSYCGLKNFAIKLQEVGQFETPMESGSYKTGQIFLHKLLAYRGIILFSWNARVYDRDVVKKHKHYTDSDESSKVKSAKGESTQTFYNVLMDFRDIPYIRSRSEIVTTFLDSAHSAIGLVLIPGMDYVAHKNIMPYRPTELQPLQHEMLDQFFTYNPNGVPKFSAKSNLHLWEKKSQSWLELTKVQQETTERLRVTVMPFYMGCRRSTYWWRYLICLENLSDLSVRLLGRHWRIFTNSGVLETVRGRGVMGHEVTLTRREPVFQYSSHVNLEEPSGHMWGTFEMLREDGLTFECVVPSFTLESRDGAMTAPEDVTD